jgi:hypothetical protein
MTDKAKTILNKTFEINYSNKKYLEGGASQGLILKKDLIILMKEMDLHFFDFFSDIKIYEGDSVTIVLNEKGEEYFKKKIK